MKAITTKIYSYIRTNDKYTFDKDRQDNIGFGCYYKILKNTFHQQQWNAMSCGMILNGIVINITKK